ncbi:unnamed protein product [Schistosoma margrebowiei]|uniref:Uncharacterized protein n=1 Tax=Schistosoma margrebowiei TaxID=48269 RepID=A0A183LF58_9TREM|nr:unnamed protein product [Schistosoma margrebowiei]
MCETRKILQNAAEMRRYNLMMLGISETHWIQVGQQQQLASGDFLLYSGHEEENAHEENTQGVALMLSKQIYTQCSCMNNYALVKDILCHIISLCQLEHNDLLTSIIEQESNNDMDVLSTEISTQINNRILRTMDKSSSSSSFPFEQIQQLLRHLGVHTILKELLNIRFKVSFIVLCLF